jgi:plastocyanin
MRIFILAALLCSGALSAQVTHIVLVGGSTTGTTPPYYDPQVLTINVGDIVQWENQSGTHNVNGTTAIFPANPEGFTSGAADNGNWTFSHTFTIPGTYNYHCTQEGHSATQFGTITVLNAQVVEQQDNDAEVVLFPVPATDVLIVDMGNRQILSAEVIGLDGKKFLSLPISSGSRVELNFSGLAHGQYYIRLIDDRERSIIRPFRKI